jgi:hypothetical protein
MNIEIEEITVNDVTIAVNGYLYKDIDDWADGKVTRFDWVLDIKKEYNHDEHCEGWALDFDDKYLFVFIKGKKTHLRELISVKDYQLILDQIENSLVEN